MKKIFMAISVALPLIFLSISPEASAQTRSSQYPKMYSEAPQVLVVMPPTNASAESGADNAVYGTIFRCLTEKGYTVIPTPMSSDYFRSVGKTASDYQGSLDEIREKFGADACVFTEIQSLEWGLKTLSSKVRMYIRSAKTGEILYDRTVDVEAEATKRTYTPNTKSKSLLGSIIGMVAKDAYRTTRAAIKNDNSSVNLASREAVQYILEDLRCGKNSTLYGKDGSKEVREQTMSREIMY